MNVLEKFVRRNYDAGRKLVLDGELLSLDDALAALPKLQGDHPECAYPPMLWES